MQVIYMTEGEYIPYVSSKAIITFDGKNKLKINVKSLEILKNIYNKQKKDIR